MSAEVSPDLQLQINVSKILARGFVFSIVWLGGIGSLIAFVSGVKARTIIKRSGGKIAGLKLAWWCIIAGALGLIISPLTIVSAIKNLSN